MKPKPLEPGLVGRACLRSLRTCDMIARIKFSEFLPGIAELIHADLLAPCSIIERIPAAIFIAFMDLTRFHIRAKPAIPRHARRRIGKRIDDVAIHLAIDENG